MNKLIPSNKKQAVRSLHENHFAAGFTALYRGSEAFQFGAASIQPRADFLHHMCHMVLMLESILYQVRQSQFQEPAPGFIGHAQVQPSFASTVIPMYIFESLHRYPAMPPAVRIVPGNRFTSTQC